MTAGVKVLSIAVVLLLAVVAALGAGAVVFALGASPLAALCSSGVSFLGTAQLGMKVLGHFVPTAP
ncbi:hypothetical protein [Streptomyces sp. NPDC048462]|uniref:hypothetical protein n=1 Tax=Streptomyces sp. NPDC048462 TaxID=3365555 RepID=UPI003722D170